MVMSALYLKLVYPKTVPFFSEASHLNKASCVDM